MMNQSFFLILFVNLQKILTSQKPGDLKGPTCYCVDIDVEIENNNLEVYSKSNDVYKHMGKSIVFKNKLKKN